MSETVPSARVVRVSGGGKAARTSETGLQNPALSVVAAGTSTPGHEDKEAFIRTTHTQRRLCVCVSVCCAWRVK